MIDNREQGTGNKYIELTTPLVDKDVEQLRVGDRVLLSGIVYTARDASQRHIVEDLEAGKELPADLKGQVLYYTGPSPAGPGRVIGSAGPTTSARMDVYVRTMLELGVKGFIGKGRRSMDVRDDLKTYKAVYFLATAGAGALLSRHITAAKVIGYPELGPEAVYELQLDRFPLIVGDDTYGDDMFEREWPRWKR